MRTIERWSGLAGLVVAVIILGACGAGGGEGDDGSDTVATAKGDGNSPDTIECPPTVDVSAAVGAAVESSPYGSGCFYQSEDFESSVVIMPISSGQADQLDREFTESAAERGTALETVDVGSRAKIWTATGMGQGYAISGPRGVMIDMQAPSLEDPPRDALTRILEMALE